MPKNKYAEMICQLAEQPQTEILIPTGFEVQSLKDADDAALYQCYYAAFSAGDAAFFFEQSETERCEYFNTLCFEEACNEPGSSVILKGGEIIGFTYVIPYGKGNCHISCMCIHPDFQRQGLGEFMLLYAMQEIAAQGNISITLGTDTNMAAFQLYRKFGFKIKEDQSNGIQD